VTLHELAMIFYKDDLSPNVELVFYDGIKDTYTIDDVAEGNDTVRIYLRRKSEKV